MSTPDKPAATPPVQGAPTIQVGGPHGVVIHGDRVEVGGMVVHSGHAAGRSQQVGYPGPAVAQRPQAGLSSAGGLRSTGSSTLQMELFRNPRRLPRLFLSGGLLFGLMAVLLAIPAMGMPVAFSVIASIFAVAALSGAFVLAQKARHLEKTRALPPELELSVLELAHANGGSLCVTQTARALKIPLDEAQEALERLAKRGHAQLDVKDEGELVYKIAQGTSASPSASPSALPASSTPQS